MTSANRHLLEVVFKQLGRHLALIPPVYLRELYNPIKVSPTVLAAVIVLGQEFGEEGVSLDALLEFLRQVKEEIDHDPKFLVNLGDAPRTARTAA